MPDDDGCLEDSLAASWLISEAAAQMDSAHDDARRRRREEERLQEQERRRRRAQEEEQRKRKLRLKGQREIARISAAHQLNGFDRNVLAQWEQSGFHGKRPQLSFELQAQWQSEKDREREQIEREREAHLSFLEKLEQQRKGGGSAPAPSGAPEPTAIEAMEYALKERHDRIRAFVYHHGPQELNAEDFLLWAETLATPEELEAFDQDCMNRARPPGSGAPFAQAFNFSSWFPWLSSDSTT